MALALERSLLLECEGDDPTGIGAARLSILEGGGDFLRRHSNGQPPLQKPACKPPINLLAIRHIAFPSMT